MKRTGKVVDARAWRADRKLARALKALGTAAVVIDRHGHAGRQYAFRLMTPCTTPADVRAVLGLDRLNRPVAGSCGCCQPSLLGSSGLALHSWQGEEHGLVSWVERGWYVGPDEGDESDPVGDLYRENGTPARIAEYRYSEFWRGVHRFANLEAWVEDSPLLCLDDANRLALRIDARANRRRD